MGQFTYLYNLLALTLIYCTWIKYNIWGPVLPAPPYKRPGDEIGLPCQQKKIRIYIRRISFEKRAREKREESRSTSNRGYMPHKWETRRPVFNVSGIPSSSALRKPPCQKPTVP
jgi:hypothetical protein